MFDDDSRHQEQPNLAEYWAIARRRRWWIVGPCFILWAAVWIVGWLLPTTYQSDALILVEQQRVPEQYVVPNVAVGLQNRLQSMTQQILSRTRLQATIDRFHLYARHGAIRAFFDSGDPVEEMRKDIQIELVQAPGRPAELTAFKIHYSARSPELAQQVNSGLVSLFIDENLKTQEQLSESTTAFLENQLEAARTKLEQQETKVRAFKAQHLGNLPSQLESNVQILSGLQTQLENTQHALDGAKQQELYLESLLQQYQSVQAGLSKSGATPEALGMQLQELRRHLTEAHSKYTEKYPDVVALKDEIAKTETLKAQIESEIASSQQGGQPERKTGTFDMGGYEGSQQVTPTATIQIQSQLKANQLEIQNYQHREKALRTEISMYQTRLNLTPATEQQMAEVARGYEESKANYNSLLQKQMQSQLATSLQQRQQGEQFRVIDPASLPDKPSAPNHFLVSVGGLVAGLALGLGLAAFLELTNVSVWEEKDLEGVVSARVLVGIPHLSTPDEELDRRKSRLMEIYAAAAIFTFTVVGNLYAYFSG